MKEHGDLDTGIQLNEYHLLSELLFADAEGLPNKNAIEASARVTHLNGKVRKEALMVTSRPKRKRSIKCSNLKYLQL